MTSMVMTRSGLATALHTEYREWDPVPDSLDSSILIQSSQDSYSQESYSYSQESHSYSQGDDNEEEAIGGKEEEESEVQGMVRRRLHNRSLTPRKPKSYTHCIQESAGALYQEEFTDDLPDTGSDDDERPILYLYKSGNFSEDIDIVKNNIVPISCGGVVKLVILLALCYVIYSIAFKLHKVRPENSRTIKSKISETLELFAEIEKRTLLSERRLEEIKKNILLKILAPLKDTPLSILILVTEEHRNAIEAEFQTITHIFNKAMKLSSSPTKTISEHSWATNKIYQDNLNTILAGKTYSLIISDFDKFSWPKARLFYQYCNGNAPYNDKLFVFLVTVEKCTEGTEVKQIEEMLEKRWFAEEGADIPALVTRISAISTCVT